MKKIGECEVCKQAKIVREPCKIQKYTYDEPLKLIHTDLMGPITPGSYICTYIGIST